MFWIKKSKIVLDCFTANENAHELFPVAAAIKFVPEWWKNAPKEYEVRELFPVSTIKRCPAVINNYKYGFMLPLWSDLALAMRGGDDWEVKFSDPTASIERHDSGQWGIYADPNAFIHLKLMSPWAFQTKSDISWLYTKPMWSFPADNNLFIAPGVIDFKNQPSTHVNMLVPLESRKPYIINAGQPIAQIIPLTEKEIDLRTHLIGKEEYMTKYTNRFSHSFTKGYIRANNIKKEKKCPFHF